MQGRREKTMVRSLAVFLLTSGMLASYYQPVFAVDAPHKQELSMIAPAAVGHQTFQDGKEIIAQMFTAAEALKSYSFDYEMVVHKGKPPIKDTGSLSFKKPRLIRVEVQSGPKKGSLAIYAADGKVHGHMGGPLRFFSASVAPNSQLVQASNGYPMVDTDFVSLVAYLKNMLKQGDFSRSTVQPVQTDKVARPTYIIDMYAPNSGRELLLKRIYADAKTLLPLYWEDYVDGKLWSQSLWQNFKANVEFPDNTFRP